MEVDVYVRIFVECAHSQQPICPDEHHANQRQSIQTELHGVQRYVVLKISLDLIVILQQFGDQIVVYCAHDAYNSSHETVELSSVDPDSVFEIVDDEYEDGCEEADCVYDGEWEVKLRSAHRQPMQHHYGIAFE